MKVWLEKWIYAILKRGQNMLKACQRKYAKFRPAFFVTYKFGILLKVVISVNLLGWFILAASFLRAVVMSLEIKCLFIPFTFCPKMEVEIYK